MKLQSSFKRNNVQTKGHLTFQCNYHVVFCPKYRRKLLQNPAIEKRFKELAYEIAEQYEFEIVELEVMPDHVHALISCNPRFWIMNCLRKLKWITARKLREEFDELVRRAPSLWTHSSFIASVGEVELSTVQTYIQNQKNV